jgi:2-oxoglutarate dehydrogenase E2 component (dihydrolipoamide succinyltransferase)
MALEMKVPSPGESISEVELATWLVDDGDWVEKDQAIAEVDSDKATLELPAEEAGIITRQAEEGDVIQVGAVVALIDTDAKRPEGAAPVAAVAQEAAPVAVAPAKEESRPAPTPAPAAPASNDAGYAKGHPSIAARKIMDENNIGSAQVNGTGKGGRITKQDVVSAMAAGIPTESTQGWGGTRDSERKKMKMLRRKIAERLVAVKNETAMLTTFNEVDMKPIMDLRAKYKVKFKEEKGTSLGFMGFFTKAVCEALNHFPAVNSMMDGDHIVYYDYADIGIAVSSPKGLMVPVVRNAEQMSLAEIEADIRRLAIKARDGKIALDEMQGGTFTITNGGVFGSMLSTPIINPPQSAILGMHNIVERPVAINGEVVIRPIMYVALSYDHRIVDGKESVGFLVKVKEMLENPERMIFGGKDPYEVLLGL